MKLAISNIAWGNEPLGNYLTFIRELGVQGVELAPSLIWPEPVDTSAEQRRELKALIKDQGLDLTGFHALLFTRQDLQLFQSAGSQERTVDYLKRLAQVCGDVGGKVMVLGSPRNRVRWGKSYEECLALAAAAFGAVAEEAGRVGVTLCIEPLSPDETEFIMSSDEGAQLVKMVNHPSFGLHLDAKAMIGSKENVEAVFRKHGKDLKHFHVGDPGLAPPGTTGVDHSPLGRALHASGYQGYVSIEMRSGFGPTREVIEKSITYVKSCYFHEK